ncbi:NUDIX hydrolase [Sphaerisporangium sp. NPDC049003]|uniref:NUDIX hydrolase n=1 Tax=Sphaerisporangium sp. NPDC049003 TaxID=3364517 RepID=UPI0037115FD6
MRDEANLEWEQLSEGPPAGFLKVKSRLYRYPDGKEDKWDILLGGATVAILALTDDDQVILARQFRPGPDRVLLEMPGGNVAGAEDIVAAAVRELREETGYEAEKAEVVMQTYLASYATHRRHAIVARGCKLVGDQKLDDAEFVDPVLMPVADFIEHVLSGQLTDTDMALAGLVSAGFLKPTV